MRKLRREGFAPVNVDATVVAQRPKLAPYLPEMRTKVAQYLGLPSEQVNIKATTEEGLGFTGSGAGIAAQAIALVEIDTGGCEEKCEGVLSDGKTCNPEKMRTFS